MVIVSLLVVSTSGLYYAFFSAMFIGLVGVCGAAAEMRGRKLTLAALQVTIIFVLMILSGWGPGIVDILAGNVHVPRRYAVEQSMYGLLIADAIRTFAVLPPLKWSLSEYTSTRRQNGRRDRRVAGHPPDFGDFGGTGLCNRGRLDGS